MLQKHLTPLPSQQCGGALCRPRDNHDIWMVEQAVV
jgi:hypothetical protein